MKVKVSKHGQWKLDELVEKGSFEEDMDAIVEDKEKPMPKGTPGVAKPHKPKSDIEPELATKVEQLTTELKDLKKMSADDIKAKAKAKDLVGVTGYGDAAKFGGGPAMTGKPRHYPLAQTKSGKSIMSTHGPQGPDNGYHVGFNAEEHRDAYFAHGKQARELKEGQVKVHPNLLAHHDDMARFHWEKYQDLLTRRPSSVDQHGMKKSDTLSGPTAKEYEAARGHHYDDKGTPSFSHLTDKEVHLHHSYVSTLPRDTYNIYSQPYRKALADEVSKRKLVR